MTPNDYTLAEWRVTNEPRLTLNPETWEGLTGIFDAGLAAVYLHAFARVLELSRCGVGGDDVPEHDNAEPHQRLVEALTREGVYVPPEPESAESNMCGRRPNGRVCFLHPDHKGRHAHFKMATVYWDDEVKP